MAGASTAGKGRATAPPCRASWRRPWPAWADQPVSTVAAGRTDAGVHATQQVASFASAKPRPLRAWRDGVNALTGPGVKVRWGAGSGGRIPCPVLRHRPSLPVPLPHRRRPRTAVRPLRLEVAALGCGRHAARRPRAVGGAGLHQLPRRRLQSKSPFRRVSRLRVRAVGGLVVLDIEANAFLLHMVRNIAGALSQVGRGERPWLGSASACKPRIVR